jgi:23S rRNA (cytidine2498-2'-O)-methyltransferase
MDARDSARLMLDYAPCLDPEGFAIVTLKLPHREPEQVVHQAIGLLVRRYEVIAARQLFHNRSEVTVALKRRMRDGGEAERNGSSTRPIQRSAEAC